MYTNSVDTYRATHSNKTGWRCSQWMWDDILSRGNLTTSSVNFLVGYITFKGEYVQEHFPLVWYLKDRWRRKTTRKTENDNSTIDSNEWLTPFKSGQYSYPITIKNYDKYHEVFSSLDSNDFQKWFDVKAMSIGSKKSTPAQFSWRYAYTWFLCTHHFITNNKTIT